jgi:hypothetical protein
MRENLRIKRRESILGSKGGAEKDRENYMTKIL